MAEPKNPVVAKRSTTKLLFEGVHPTTRPPPVSPSVPSPAGASDSASSPATPTPPPPSPPASPTMTIEPPKKGHLIVTLRRKTFTYEAILAGFIEYQAKNPAGPGSELRSKGYVLLMNTILEVKAGDGARPSGGRRGRGGHGGRPRGGGGGQTSLVVGNAARFIPTRLEKNLGMWSEDSDEHFKLTVNQILNKLTFGTIDAAVREVNGLLQRFEPPSEDHPEPLTAKGRKDHLVSTIIYKAVREQAFVKQYAEFVRRSDPLNGIRDPVVGAITNEVNFSIMNSHEADTDDFALTATGAAKFFGALARRQTIAVHNYCEVLLVLVARALEKAHPVLIEMLRSFVLAAKAEVVRAIDESAPDVWRQFLELLERKGLRKRIHFMLVDVDEKRRQWLEGTAARQASSAPLENRVSNEAIVIVRHAFTNFMDGTQVGCQLPVPDFLRTALEMYPDQLRDHYAFAQFICAVLGGKSASPAEVKDVMVERVKRCIDTGAENDCPSLWNIMSDLIYLMIIRGLLAHEHARLVRNTFPDARPGGAWSIDGMKWFLHDFYEFDAPAEVESSWPLEIRDALAMPATIENPPAAIPMSRLIAVALVRAIGDRIGKERTISIESFQKWRRLLAIAFERQRETTIEEIVTLIDTLGLESDPDEIARYCRV